MLRVIRGLVALITLLVGLAGVPAALLVLGGNPFPDTLSWQSVRFALLTPDDGTVLLGLITLVGWIAWLVFALSVVTESVAMLSRQRIRIRVPGLGGPQRLAAGLIVSVISMLTIPQVAQPPSPMPAVTTFTMPVSSSPVLSSPVDLQASVGPSRSGPDAISAAGVAGAAAAGGATHVVTVGDDLWSLAEHYYGEGRDWRKIAAANPKLLTGGPDRLEPGWRLTIPDVDAPVGETDQPHVTVRGGDTLAKIADRELGAAGRWPTIYQLNRSQLSDPDELPTGMELTLPARAGSTPPPPAAEDGGVDEANPQPGGERETHERASGHSESAPVPESAPAAPSRPAAPRDAQAPAEPSADELPGPGPVEASDGFVLPLAGVGGLLAAGLLGGLAVRRRMQLQSRPVGRRIAQPPAPAQAVETALGKRQRPLSQRTLDRASRAVAAHCRRTGAPLPPLIYALVGERELELVMAGVCPDAPVGFRVDGRSWLLDQADAGYLSSIPGLSEAPRPWPALVTLGRDEQQRVVVGDLEAMGMLALASPHPDPPQGVLAAMAVELSFSPWADEMILTLVGSGARLPEALGKHNVSRTDDLDGLLSRLEHRAAVQRKHQPEQVLGQHRIDPDLADPWAPEIVLINAPLSPSQQHRLAAVVTAEPRVTMAAVVVGAAASAPWSLQLAAAAAGSAVLLPAQVPLAPQYLDPPTVSAVVDLVAATGSEVTTPAQWWGIASEPPDPPPDNVTYLGKRFGGWGSDGDDQTEGARMKTVAAALGDLQHPTLQLLGPIGLLGATGSSPPRAAKQCLEYCAWLLEHPGTTAQAMASALIVAEGTRRSNMSRLRGWLGSDPAGEPYLPDAYTGRILLSASVSSDWQHLQILTAAGVNRASTEGLRAALDLVRGAPLADAAPGQWHWAEELRTDMVSCLRDIGVELATRALDDGDIDLARWSAARALVAAPGDGLLMAARIRTEHRAGNPAETERLTLQLAAQARALGVDLDEATVILLQQVMEGRVRARMA